MSINISSSCFNDTAGQPNNIFTVCTYLFITIVGFIFNITSLAFFFSCTKSRSQTVTYMTNLAIADTLLILTLPMRIYHYLGYDGLPQWLCDVLGLILKANMYGSIFLLTCICCDRCLAVNFPMSLRVKQGRKKAPLICAGIWILTFGASLPIYLSKRKQDPASSQHCFGSLPVYATQPLVVFPTLLLGFGIPFVIMLVCSWGLARAVRQSTVAQTNLVDGPKIQRMITSSLLIFIFSFLPYHAILGLISFYRNIPCSMLAAYQYSVMVACLNAVLDPVAYYFTTETFRKNVGASLAQRMLPLNSHSSETRCRVNNT